MEGSIRVDGCDNGESRSECDGLGRRKLTSEASVN